MKRAFVALGSNRGDRAGYLGIALRHLVALPKTRLIATSHVYETRAVGPGVQRHYLNAVAELATELEPPILLEALLGIEQLAGRRRSGTRWGPRRLDLDLLLVGDCVVRDARLELPHPRLAERAFVLQPFADLAPDQVHPCLGVSIADLAKRVRDPQNVWRWPGRFIFSPTGISMRCGTMCPPAGCTARGTPR